MEFGIFELLKLIGALGFFIYGMKIMSEGIQKAAGNRMRQILGAMTSNRVIGVLTGFLITCLIQSSSATTVMVVSFVNAGLLTLIESIGVIMGANIGTTITAWLISIFGFKVKISAMALPIIAVGFPMMFSSKSTVKAWAEFLIGFALLFMGLDHLKHSVPDLKQSPEILGFVSEYTNMGVWSLLIFITIGTLLTVTVQSSSAAMALTLVMCNEGWIPFEMAAGMVLGENIGTTITANLAALVGNVHAKRSARAHLVFNLFGVAWMIVMFNFFVRGIDTYLTSSTGLSPSTDPTAIPIALSIFHTVFNVINVLLLIWFVKFIAKIVEKMVPSRGEIDEQYHLEYIETGIMGTPEISILEAKKEVVKFGKLTKKMMGFIITLLNEQDKKEIVKLLNKIAKYEDITDKIEEEVTIYLTKVAEGELSEDASIRIRGMLSMVGDMERIGDIIYQMSKNIERKNDDSSYFTPEQRNNLLEMIAKVNHAFDVMNHNLADDRTQVTIDKAREAEKEINLQRDVLRKDHLKSMEQGDYNIKSGMVYSDLYSSCEKIGDHIINVTEAIMGKV